MLDPLSQIVYTSVGSQRTWNMTLHITWQEAPVYPALIKGPSVGIVDGSLLVAGGMAYPWREAEYGFGAPIIDDADDAQNGAPPIGEWYPLPPIPIGPGWTSGTAVAGGLAVVGGRRRAVGNRATADVWFLDIQAGATDWIRLPDRPTTAMVATTFAHDDQLYTAFGTDWHPHEHATGDPNIYRLDVRAKSGWEVVARFPGEPRWMCGMGICGNKLYIVGGHDIPVGGVVESKPHNAFRLFADPAAHGGKISHVTFRENWECDLATGEWRELPRPPRAFVADAFTVADRWIVLTGGQSWVVNPDGTSVLIMGHVPELDLICLSHEVWAYDTQEGSWLALDPLPYGIASHRVAVWQDRVFLVGNETRDKIRSNTFGTVFAGKIHTD